MARSGGSVSHWNISNKLLEQSVDLCRQKVSFVSDKTISRYLNSHFDTKKNMIDRQALKLNNALHAQLGIKFQLLIKIKMMKNK